MVGNYYKQINTGVVFKIQAELNGEFICRVANSVTIFYIPVETLSNGEIIQVEAPKVDLTKSAQIRGITQIGDRSLY